MKKFIKMLLLVFFLIVILIYTLVIEKIPENIVLFQGEEISFKTLFGIRIKKQADILETSSNNNQEISDKIGSTNLKVSLFNKITLKEINIDVIPKTKVVLIGKIAGVKLYTSGVLVVGMSEIRGQDNKKYKPYENTGIEEGDTITKINEIEINSTDELIEKVNNSNGEELNIEYLHENEIKECSITPVKQTNNEYKLGLWVRDSAAGVGTVTFYEPETKTFGALGHGISDIDTGKLIDISKGEFVTTKILNIEKGQKGEPGKIQGSIEKGTTIGNINKNTKFGIYGLVDNLSAINIDMSKEMEVALRDEIKIGKATILCSLDNEIPQEYEIEIEKIYRDNNYDNKSMGIKVTDEKLLEKTGGIIQGMSGSPIIQNGKFIGALTHVLVNNPEEGYGVFADIMIKQSKEVN